MADIPTFSKKVSFNSEFNDMGEVIVLPFPPTFSTYHADKFDNSHIVCRNNANYCRDQKKIKFRQNNRHFSDEAV